MNRRGFLKGAVSVMAIAAVLKIAPAPAQYVHRRYGMAESYTSTWLSEEEVVTIGENYSTALARSMMQTKEVVGAKVLGATFG